MRTGPGPRFCGTESEEYNKIFVIPEDHINPNPTEHIHSRVRLPYLSQLSQRDQFWSGKREDQ